MSFFRIFYSSKNPEKTVSEKLKITLFNIDNNDTFKIVRN